LQGRAYQKLPSVKRTILAGRLESEYFSLFCPAFEFQDQWSLMEGINP
jgi:hypothetical protein